MRREPNPLVRQRLAVDAPAANTSAVVTLAADANEEWVIHTVSCSYDAAPTAGQVTIALAADTIVLDITATGPNHFEFPIGLRCGAKNTAVTVTLKAAGVGVVGSLAVTYR